MTTEEWIGVDEVAAEMKYTQRQAWGFIKSIGLVLVNARRMDLARFTRAQFNEARERAMAPIPGRSRLTSVSATGEPRVKGRESAASGIARFKRA